MPFFGQEILLQAEKKGPLTSPAYRKALGDVPHARADAGIDAVMTRRTGSTRSSRRPAARRGPTDLVNGDHFLGASSTPAAVAGYPEHHRAGRLRLRAAGRRVVHRPGRGAKRR